MAALESEKLVRPRRHYFARFVRVLSAGSAALLLVLLLLQLGVDRVEIVTPSGQLWIHVGQGRLAIVASDEPGPRSVEWRSGWNHYSVNDPEMYFGPCTNDVDLLGLQYVSGTRFKTPYTGWAIRVSYWYGVALSVLLFAASHRRLREWRQQRAAARRARGPYGRPGPESDYAEWNGGSVGAGQAQPTGGWGPAEPVPSPERAGGK